MHSPADNKKTVLIVEDEPDNREIMRAIIEEMLGLHAVVAPDGDTALSVVGQAEPVVILMDLMMPVLDGFEAIKRLKADPATSHIPVIAVTALGRPTDRQRALDNGADEYLCKPFDIDVLIETLIRYTRDSDPAEDPKSAISS